MDILTTYNGYKAGPCERGLYYGVRLYLKPNRPSPVLLGFYCGTKNGYRVVQQKNSVGTYLLYTPTFAATEGELIKWW